MSQTNHNDDRVVITMQYSKITQSNTIKIYILFNIFILESE